MVIYFKRDFIVRILLLNLPHPYRVQRRYRCSYRAPNFLFPPLELLSIGGTLRSSNESVRLIDSIAEGWDIVKTALEVRRWSPDVILTMPGFEILAADLAVLGAIMESAPNSKTALFGYLPSLYPEKLLDASGTDAVIVGEPENAALRLVKDIEAGPLNTKIYRDERIKNLDDLPPPSYSLVTLDHYGDFLFPKPFAVLQTGRGCPFGCTYCVRPYGHKVAYRSAGKVIEDVEHLVRNHGIKGLRFEDDTFPVDPDRAAAISRGIRPFNIAWSCLSRPDTMSAEIAEELYSGGCRRVYLGIESGSDRILELLGRGHSARQGLDAALAIKNAGMEVAGFFLVGVPGETGDDLRAGIELAKEAALDFVGVSTLVPYPGTPLFESGDYEVTFELLPFYSHFADPEIIEIGKRREKEFYREYYYRPRYAMSRLGLLVKNPLVILKAAASLSRHLIRSREAGKHGDLI